MGGKDRGRVGCRVPGHVAYERVAVLVRRRSHHGHQRRRGRRGRLGGPVVKGHLPSDLPARRPKAAPGAGQRLPEPAHLSWLPRMHITSGDASEVSILWQEIVFSSGSHGGEVFFAHSTDGGRTFSDPMNLSKSIAGDGKGRLTPRYWHNGSLELAVGPQGDLYAAWTEYEGTLWVSRSTDRGDTFSEPLRIAGAGDAKPTRGPSTQVMLVRTASTNWPAAITGLSPSGPRFRGRFNGCGVANGRWRSVQLCERR